MKRMSALVIIGLLCLSTFSMFAPRANASDSLVGYWKFDEGSGSVAYDSAGTNDGVIRGAPSWTTGIVGGTLRFDGAQNNYVALSSQLDVTDAMTVEAWVYPEFDPTNPAEYPEPFGCAGRQIVRKSSCGDDTFFLGFYSGYYFDQANPVPYISAGFFYQGGGGANIEPVWIPGLISQGQWYHLVATFQRNDYVRLYVNGVEVKAVPTEDKPLRVSSRHLTIGQEADTVGGDPLDTPSYPQTWIGKIDEAKIYNYARTAEEIQGDCFHGWELDFAAPTNHPIVDFAVYNGSLYAAADNKLYVKNGSIWNVVEAPTFVTSLETMIGTSSVNSTYGGPGLEEANCLIQTSDGGYVLAGQNATGSGGWDFRWVKTDANGVVQWSHSYGTGADDRAYSAVQTADGGYALAGDVGAGFGDGDFWLIRADANGNTLWNKTYGTPNYNGATSIVQTPDGGFALSGWTDSPMGNPNAWLVKTDENGSLQWDKIFGGPYYDGSNSMILTADGGYALAGQSRSYGEGGYDFWLVKTDSSGNMQWDRTYGGTSDDLAYSVIATSDGGYVLIGSTTSFGSGSEDFWLVKTDADGYMQWNRTYGGIDVDQGRSLRQTIDGGYVLAGYTRSFGAGPGDAWVVRTDTSGNVEWNQTYGGTGDDCARSLIETYDGEYAFAGYTWSSGSGASDFWLVKTESKPYLFCGGQGRLHLYDGVGFTKIFDVSTYVKALGVYENTLYMGTMLDNPPKLYYCNGPPENPANWHIDTDFSDILDFSGPFGSIDSFAVYNGKMYVASGNTVYCFDGTSWSTALSYEYAYAFLDMQVYNGKLYLATRDQNRIPLYLGGTGFSGVIVEFDGENWTTVLGHDYWIYSLEEYDGKLYVGTENRIYTYNGTFWAISFYAAEGAYYAISMINYDGKIYAGMGNGYIFADPAPPKPNPETTAVPEFSPATVITVFMTLTIPAAVLIKKKRTRRFN